LSEYRALMKRMAIGIISAVVVLSALALVLIGTVLQIVGKQIYADNRSIFGVLLVTVSLLAISYIPHYSLFVKKRDRAIILGTVAAFIVSLAANSFLVPEYGLEGAAYATMIAMASMVVIKSAAALKSNRGQCRT